MELRIVCFEDSRRYQSRLVESFADADRPASFRFYSNPKIDWIITADRAKEISVFNPHFIVVDLIDQSTKNKDGLRIIRQLKDFPETSDFPVIAWSVAFTDTAEGTNYMKLVKEGYAEPIFKHRKNRPSVYRFLKAAKLEP
jgi:CheY-like chemotaxis protein